MEKNGVATKDYKLDTRKLDQTLDTLRNGSEKRIQNFSEENADETNGQFEKGRKPNGSDESLNDTDQGVFRSSNDISSKTDDSSDEDQRSTPTDIRMTEHPVVRAQSARELVRSQEHLLGLLQTMTSDLNKMDREAERIKEDIVRSHQLFHVMSGMKKPHYLSISREGYNISHSLPKVTYHRSRRRERVPDMRYLNQLSTYKPSFLSDSSRRSSLSREIDNFRSRLRSRNSSDVPSPGSCLLSVRQRNSSSSDSYSGTESDMELSVSRQMSRTGSSSSISQYFSDVSSAKESSGDDFVETLGSYQRHRFTDAGRRSSYFYTTRAEASPQVLSDEIEI